MADLNWKPHAIMISFHLQGHIIPYVHLAIKLASKGLTITFVHTQSIHQQIIKAQSDNTPAGTDIFSEARTSGLDIRYMTVSDGLPVEFDRSVKSEQYWESFLNVFPVNIDDLVGEIVRREPSSELFLIADTFYLWPEKIAKKYNLVNVSFWTEPALVFNLYYHLDLLRQNGHFGSNDNRKGTIDYIPGVKAIEPKDLMSYLQDTDLSSVIHWIIFRAFEEEVKKADFVLCNTVQELEAETIASLQQRQPFYAVGPIFPTGFTKSVVATSLWSESDCTHWLNTKSHGSVLYVSFGSLAQANQLDIVEIAHGLLLSEVNFVWVIRPGMVSSDDTNILPVGFEENIKGRGLIVPWCTQIEVISNPAIGGFLTHCGWNSTLESIWCGVPLLCFPLFTDQFTNRKLVVDDWKIGLNLCDGESITREEVAEKISHLMGGKSLDELRKETKKVRKVLEDALATDGSTEKNFDRFIKDVKAKIRQKHEDRPSNHS
ncbi:unnamed protein product [Ilex paraguariensis]|uniref:Glycosyltransferase n=1 Tax=Ilex paraguariensis TaxID=185542 RepID=A0ABC8SEJ9_9AQUA